MKVPKVLVIGSTGMLGRAVSSQLELAGVTFLESSRETGLRFDVFRDSADSLIASASLSEGDYIVNCVGLTKAHIFDNSQNIVRRAVLLNVLFPMNLSMVAEQRGLRVLQVATDCVFSGKKGKYLETSGHDALDVYGKTKSLGEVTSDNVMHLRCSLIGSEGRGRKSLFFEWVRATPRGSTLKGYVNHRWNGLTSNTFGRIVAGLVESDSFVPGVQHLVPADQISKFELISLELEMLGRDDVNVEPLVTDLSVDRTLATEFETRNKELFASAGYRDVPSIREMMEELPWLALEDK